MNFWVLSLVIIGALVVLGFLLFLGWRLVVWIDQLLRGNRRELSQSLKDSTDSLDKRLNQVSRTQQNALLQISDRIEQQLKGLQRDNHQQLERMRQTVDEKLQSTLEKRFNASFRQVDEKLKILHEGLGEMKNLAGNVGDLQRTLTNVSSRGAWGEAQLGNLLAEILGPGQYETNFSTKKNSTARVEFAIKMPLKDNQAMYLPIDAKFPMTRYETLLAAIEAGDKSAIDAARKELGQHLKAEAKKISEKYLDPPRTTNFAILYLPAEGLFAEAAQEAGLIDELRRDHRVTLAGPTTISAMLGVVQIGYQTLEIQQRTGEIWTRLTALREDFSKFGVLLDKAQKKISEAGSVIETASSKQRNIGRQLNRFKAIKEPEVGDDPLLAE